MIKARVHPVVGLRQAQLGGAAFKAGIQAQGWGRRFDLLQRRQQLVLRGHVGWDQAGVGRNQPGAADDLRCAQLNAVFLQAHAHGATVFDEDLLNPGVGEYVAAGRLNQRDNGRGDAYCAADREVAASDVVLGDHRVHHERSLGRRQAVVAPLRGEQADQLAVVGQAFEHFQSRFEEIIR